MIGIPTTSNNDSSNEINRKRRDLSSVSNDQENESENVKLTNLVSITVSRNFSSDTELANNEKMLIMNYIKVLFLYLIKH